LLETPLLLARAPKSKGVKMRTIVLCLFVMSGIQALAAETCVQLSKDGKCWTNPAQTLCISKLAKGSSSEYRIDLNLGVGQQKRTIASYFLNSLPSGGDTRAFGPSDMDSTLFDDSVTIGIGHDEVYIGSQMFFSKDL